MVQLSDSTKVWLNSDSKFRYPVRFGHGEERRVELVYGEAYFEVSPSSRHQGAGFHVVSKSQVIEVLGTVFNINAYDGEREIATTLVEGKVKVSSGAISKVLKPNQQSQVGENGGFVRVAPVDASRITSWVKGLFVFEEAPLGDLMKVLARWYNAEVFFENEKHKQFRFTGVLERTKAIVDILDLIEASSDGQVTFKVKGRAILIQ